MSASGPGYRFRFTSENQKLRVRLERGGMSRSQATKTIAAAERRAYEAAKKGKTPGKKATSSLRASVRARVTYKLNVEMLELYAVAELARQFLEQETPRGERIPAFPDGYRFSPSRTDKGHLADRWVVDVVPSSTTKIQFVIKNEHPDAKWLLDLLEYGSTPHEITHRTGKKLRFFWKAVGGIVHFDRVRWKPSPARPPFLAVTRAKVLIRREIAKLRKSR